MVVILTSMWIPVPTWATWIVPAGSRGSVLAWVLGIHVHGVWLGHMHVPPILSVWVSYVLSMFSVTSDTILVSHSISVGDILWAILTGTSGKIWPCYWTSTSWGNQVTLGMKSLAIIHLSCIRTFLRVTIDGVSVLWKLCSLCTVGSGISFPYMGWGHLATILSSLTPRF